MDGDPINSGPTPEQVPGPLTPEQPASGPRPEQAPAGPEKTGERIIQPERTSAPAPAAPPATAQPVVMPVPIPAKDDQVDNDMPAVADDVDVIEMEWVNKAKEIIHKTKDDPYAQEQAVEKLQRDYLKKRYGKEIKAAT